MHWEKKICIRITLRRIVGTILAASTIANLIIVGAVYGADSAPPASPGTSGSDSALPTEAGSTAAAAPEGTLSPELTLLPGGAPIDTPGITLTATLVPTELNGDQPGWTLCIRKFYWTSYRVKPGDTLFSLALATGSTVRELMSANCLPNSRINAGQVLYVPRVLVNTYTPTPTSTLTATFTPTATFTLTPTPSHTPTETPTSTFTHTPTYTPTHTYTPTSTPTATEIPSSTPTSTPTIELNSAPSVGIESPLNESRYPYAGRDETRNLWFSEVELIGVASDLEDDVVNSAVWSTDFSHPNASRVLGNELIAKAILYSNVCAGMWHTVILTVTDSQGQAARARVRIFIGDQQQC